MTEADWLNATDPQPMLDFLRTSGKLSDRKARLFAVACCRRIWPLLTDERSQRAVEVAERFADGRATPEELEAVCTIAHEHAFECNYGVLSVAAGAAAETANQIAAEEAEDVAASTANTRGMAFSTAGTQSAGYTDETVQQAKLLRDLFGNPFRPPPLLDPYWLAWNDGTVKQLAEDAYEQRAMPAGTLDPQRLGVLADALEAAGCLDAELLGHLRGPGPHVRGCWALDLVLGKE